MKKQILMSIMTIGITSMLIGTGTYACFRNVGMPIDIQSNHSNCRNLIDIRDNDEWWGHGVTATWTASGMLPGDEFPFYCRFVGLKRHQRSPPAKHIGITCDYMVTDDDNTESDTDWNTDQHPDSMAKQMIITRCKYLGWGPYNYINCLTDPNSEWRIQDMDGDEKITFFDFKCDPLSNLPVPKKWWSRDWFVLSVKFDENADNRFQGDIFDFTICFTAVR